MSISQINESAKQSNKADEGVKHLLKIGDVLRSSWGYEQTNIDYYQVTAYKGKCTVEIREIRAMRTRQSGDYGTCLPIKNDFKGDAIVKRVCKSGTSVRINSFSSARKKDCVVVGGVEIFSPDNWTDGY